MQFHRRNVLAGLLACAVTPAAARPVSPSSYERSLYGAVTNDKFPIPAVNLSRIRQGFLRAQVSYPTHEPAGTIVIDPRRHYLYFINGDGTAMRYGVGVGRQGFAWKGVATINSKQEWPDWYPPKEMLERQPHLMRSMSTLRSGIGMHGGPRNPLGARALYLWQNNKDTLYRIHGTTEPWTIGANASSGCIRMINQDAIDLYQRVRVGAKVVVLGSGARNEIAIEPDRSSRGRRMQAERMQTERFRVEEPRFQGFRSRVARPDQRAPLDLNPYPMDRTW
ncbi:MAG: L,D-transpeptidase [Rhodoblastus sp.]